MTDEIAGGLIAGVSALAGAGIGAAAALAGEKWKDQRQTQHAKAQTQQENNQAIVAAGRLFQVELGLAAAVIHGWLSGKAEGAEYMRRLLVTQAWNERQGRMAELLNKAEFGAISEAYLQIADMQVVLPNIIDRDAVKRDAGTAGASILLDWEKTVERGIAAAALLEERLPQDPDLEKTDRHIDEVAALLASK